MALVGNISGSSSTNSLIGVTGSVIFSNNPGTTFPSSLPGADVQFFVSGSIGGKGGSTRNVAVIGGDAVVSGSLTVGTGSVTITSNEIQFLGGAAKITSSSNGLTFFDSSYPAGKSLTDLVAGGGSGASQWTGTSQIYTTSSVAIGISGTAASQGTDLSFFVSGSTAPGSGNALFGGRVITSGSINVKDSSGTVTAAISTLGAISGSGTFLAGGDITTAGDLAVNGGDITTTATTFNVVNTTATTVNIAGGASVGTNIGNAAGLTTIAGDLKVSGNDIKSSTGDTTITMTGKNLEMPGNLVVKGDLYVSGTTVTVDATTVEIQDPIIGLGFASGSVAAAAGDRGFVGGITGAGNNVAFVWSNANSAFVATRTVTAPGAAPVAVSNLLPLRAGKFEVGSATNYLSSSTGNEVTLNAGTLGFNFNKSGTQLLAISDYAGTGEAIIRSEIGSTLNTLWVSGSSVNIGHATAGKIGILANDVQAGSIKATSGTGINIAAVAGDGTSLALTLSGSSTTINHGSGVAIQKHGVQNLGINTAAGTTTISGSSNGNVTLAAGTGATTLALSGSNVNLVGSSVNLYQDATLIAYAGTIGPTKGFFPNADATFNLGDPTKRWANIYTGDLHLRNDRGNWTIIEEEDYLSITNNLNGKRYKFVLQEI